MRDRLFIVGAPKCGTTSLANWLAEHPEIYMSRIKEPHFFNTDMKNRTITNQADYEALFALPPPEARVLAEASTWYLYSDEAVPNILTVYPDARFIVMVRDPVEMAISLFYHNRFKFYEPLETMEAAWAAQERRKSDSKLPRGCEEPAFLQYRDACNLEPLLRRLRTRVNPDHLLILQLEQVRSNPRDSYLSALRLLNLADDGRTVFPVRNKARVAKSLFIERALKGGADIKRTLGINWTTGIRKYNRARLQGKAVPQELRDRMAVSFGLSDSIVDNSPKNG